MDRQNTAMRSAQGDSSLSLAVAGNLLIVYILWGSTYLAIRLAVETLPPFLSAATRFLIAGALMVGFLWVRGRLSRSPSAQLEPIRKEHWRSAAIIGGLQAPSGLLQTAYIGAGAFVLLVLGGLAAFLSDRPLLIAGRAIDAVLRMFPSKRDAHGTGERLLLQRDALRHAFGARWPYALCGIAGKPAFDYLGLVCCLAAVGARPNPSLVILAYSGAVLLTLIPFTPGGLGFVEAGLTGLLALAGATAHQAVVATLAYRLLVFWLPLPLGGLAYALHRRRYGTEDASASATSP